LLGYLTLNRLAPKLDKTDLREARTLLKTIPEYSPDPKDSKRVRF